MITHGAHRSMAGFPRRIPQLGDRKRGGWDLGSQLPVPCRSPIESQHWRFDQLRECEDHDRPIHLGSESRAKRRNRPSRIVMG
jgi:hypothetical protein